MRDLNPSLAPMRLATIQCAEITTRNSDGMTPLLIASLEKDDPTGEVISALLEAGADVNASIQSNSSASLMWAAKTESTARDPVHAFRGPDLREQADCYEPSSPFHGTRRGGQVQPGGWP